MKLFLLSLVMACTSTLSFSQSDTERLSVFIDCRNCDQNFIKQEITYLTYVRDRLLSDVHIQIVDQNTGSGGDLYTFFFYGQGDLVGNDDTLSITTDANNTFDEVRRKQLKVLELGLVNYMMKKGHMDQMSLMVETTDSTDIVEEKDPWNNWVVSLRANGWFNGEEQYKSMNLNGGININRITEDWKIESGVWMNYNTSEYHVDDEIITSERRALWADVSVVKSLGNHFSTGLAVDAFSSLFENYKLNTSLSPAVEYNIFRYSESTKHQIRISYKAGVRYNEYNEETIYNRNSETLMFENLGIATEFQEKWGSVEASVNGSHYFHNFSINRINFRLALNLRLFKGFTWNISGNLALIHDQISLPLGDATEEDVLLSQRQLQTGYRYWGNMGFSYTFGSIYNNVVNPRFGN
jgi:hypothetical protein